MAIEETEDQLMSPTGSMGRNPTNHYSAWRNGMFMSMDCRDSPGLAAARRSQNGGVGESTGREEVCKTQFTCQHQQLLPNIEYIANCYRNTRATAKRTGEWKKVAKVLD